MKKTLKAFNFGESFINWINVFYTDSQSCVYNNGHMSEFFTIERGVRQGCPLSHLFIIAIEILSHLINSDTNIKGITIVENEIKNTMFADDATFFTDGSPQSIESLFKQIKYFGKLSGLNLNKSKTTILRCGPLKHTSFTCCKNNNFNRTSDKASTLGMVYTNNKSDIFKNNFQPKLDQFVVCLNKWSRHNLTPIGKICVLKTFALPKLIFPLTMLENPKEDIIKTIKDTMFRFLWNGKPDKIKRNVIIQDYNKGGLKMIEIDSYINALKTKWIKRILDENNKGLWKEIYLKEVNKLGGTTIFKTNLACKNVQKLNIKSEFMLQIIQAWAKINYSEIDIANEHISKQILWNNSNIKNNRNLLFFKDWYEKGIVFLEHVYDYRSKTFLTFENLKFIFDVKTSDYLKYFTLIKSIPKLWKDKLKEENINLNYNAKYLLDSVTKNKNKNNILYITQIEKLTHNLVINSQRKWEIEFQNINWKLAYTSPIKCTIDTKLRYFQYKYLMKILPCNKFLLKCKIVNSSLCVFCNMNEETVKHLFWECPVSRNFWNRLELFLHNKGFSIDLNFDIITFCSTKYQIFNFIILLAKYFIFSNKYKKNIPDLGRFIQYIYKRKEVEKLIALKKDKIEFHNRKWAKFV